MNYLTFSFKNVKRHKARSLLTMSGIAIATCTLFAILSFDAGYDIAVREELKNSGVHLFVSTEGCALEAANLILHGGEIPKFLPGNRLKEVKAIEGVKEAAGFLIFSLPKPDGKSIDLFYGITDEVKSLKSNWKIVGKWFKDENSIILGSEVAEIQNKKVGDKIFIETVKRDFLISGIIEKTNTQDDSFYYLPLITAQKTFRKENKLTAVGVQLDDFFQIQQVKDKLESLPDVYVITSEQIGNDITTLVSGTKALMYAVLSVVIIVSGIGVLNTVLMAAMERKKELGYIRCIGASRFDLAQIMLLETLMICFAGWLAGLILGFLLSSGIEIWIRNYLPYVPAGKLLRPDMTIIATTFISTMTLGLIAGLYPAIKCAKVSPVEAIRYE